MAYYHHVKAVEAHSSQLALFELPPLEAGIEDIEWVIYRPVSQHQKMHLPMLLGI